MRCQGGGAGVPVAEDTGRGVHATLKDLARAKSVAPPTNRVLSVVAATAPLAMAADQPDPDPSDGSADPVKDPELQINAPQVRIDGMA